MFTQNLALRIRSTSNLFHNPNYFSFSLIFRLFQPIYLSFIFVYLCVYLHTSACCETSLCPDMQ